MRHSNEGGHPRRIALGLAALALLAAADPAALPAAGSRPLLQTGELQVSERVFLIGTTLKKQQASPEERARRAEEQLLRLRQRLVLATAGLSRGLDKDPRVLRALDEFRVSTLVDAYYEEEVRTPARRGAKGADSDAGDRQKDRPGDVEGGGRDARRGRRGALRRRPPWRGGGRRGGRARRRAGGAGGRPARRSRESGAPGQQAGGGGGSRPNRARAAADPPEDRRARRARRVCEPGRSSRTC